MSFWSKLLGIGVAAGAAAVAAKAIENRLSQDEEEPLDPADESLNEEEPLAEGVRPELRVVSSDETEETGEPEQTDDEAPADRATAVLEAAGSALASAGEKAKEAGIRVKDAVTDAAQKAGVDTEGLGTALADAGRAVADAASAVASTVAEKVREEAPIMVQKGKDAVNAVAARFAADEDEEELEDAEAPEAPETPEAEETPAPQPDESDPV